jgi:ABC-2 type transport system permease protein
MRSEIGAVYGPLVIAGVAIAAAAGSTAGEEEDGILGLVLAHPIGRTDLILAKAAAVAVSVLIVAFGTFAGLVLGVVVAGGGIGLGNLLALTVHLACFGFAVGAVALAVAGVTGRRAVAAGGAAAYAVLGFLINGFAPLVDGLTWLKYVSPFYYYSGHDPLGSGLDLVDLAVLGAASLALVALAALAFQRRDLRA